MNIRTAVPGDIAAISSLLAENELPIDDIKENKVFFYVGETNKDILGVIGIEIYDGVGLLRSLAIKETLKNTGLGSQLVSFLIDRAKKQNLKNLYLLTTTAELYFPKFGFKPIDRKEVPESIQSTKEFKEICPDSAIVMFLNLEE